MRQLKKFHDIPVSTQEEHRGSRHNSRTTLVLPSHPERRVHFPASSGRESRRSCRTSRGGGLHLTCHHFKRPLMSQWTPDTPDFSELTRRSSRGPTQNTMAGVTALCFLERKPPIPMVNTTGRLTLLFLFERSVDLHGSTRDEACFPCGRPRGTLRSMSALERNSEVPALTPDEDLGPDSDCRGIPRGP